MVRDERPWVHASAWRWGLASGGSMLRILADLAASLPASPSSFSPSRAADVSNADKFALNTQVGSPTALPGPVCLRLPAAVLSACPRRLTHAHTCLPACLSPAAGCARHLRLRRPCRRGWPLRRHPRRRQRRWRRGRLGESLPGSELDACALPRGPPLPAAAAQPPLPSSLPPALPRRPAPPTRASRASPAQGCPPPTAGTASCCPT